MREHRIRLRGGWECHYRDGDDAEGIDVSRRVDLPLARVEDLPARFRLHRQFGRPPSDPELERVALEFRDVPGLKSARLNGRPIGPGLLGGFDRTVELDSPLLPRNGLVLEVERDELTTRTDRPWGEIALVFRAK